LSQIYQTLTDFKILSQAKSAVNLQQSGHWRSRVYPCSLVTQSAAKCYTNSACKCQKIYHKV